MEKGARGKWESTVGYVKMVAGVSLEGSDAWCSGQLLPSRGHIVLCMGGDMPHDVATALKMK